jgi:PKD repeat protein
MSPRNYLSSLLIYSKKLFSNRINLIQIISVITLAVLISSCSNEPDAGFNMSTDVAAIGAEITFTNSSSDAKYYQWDFGDGSYAITANPTHSYTESGTYNVTLKAIGKNKSSSVTKQITVTGEITIFPGVGISEISLGDTWDSINNRYPISSSSADDNDTVEYIDTYNSYYVHIVYYYNRGIAVYFLNSSATEIASTDDAVEVCVLDPYEGYTAKGIGIGSDKSYLTNAYGSPDKYTGSSYYIYYYDDLGIQFWTSSSSTLINEIDTYYSSSSTSSAVVSSQKVLDEQIRISLKKKLLEYSAKKLKK